MSLFKRYRVTYTVDEKPDPWDLPLGSQVHMEQVGKVILTHDHTSVLEKNRKLTISRYGGSGHDEVNGRPTIQILNGPKIEGYVTLSKESATTLRDALTELIEALP